MIALVADLGLAPRTVVVLERGSKSLEALSSSLRLRGTIEVDGRVFSYDATHVVRDLYGLAPDAMVGSTELGRNLLYLASLAIAARGPLACIPKTIKFLRANVMGEERRRALCAHFGPAGVVDPLELGLDPGGEAVAAFREALTRLEAVDGGALAERLLALIPIAPGSSGYRQYRDAVDLVVSVLLTRTAPDARIDRDVFDALERQVERLLEPMMTAFLADPALRRAEARLRAIGYVVARAPCVVLQSASPGGDAAWIAEQAAAHGALAIAVLDDVDPSLDGGVAMHALAGAAASRGLHVSMSLPPPFAVGPGVSAPPREHALVCAQHVALRPPYASDVVPLRRIRAYVEPGAREGRHGVLGGVAFLAALRRAGCFDEGPLRFADEVAFEWLDPEGRSRWSEPLLEPSDPEPLLARGFALLPFHRPGAPSEVASVQP